MNLFDSSVVGSVRERIVEPYGRRLVAIGATVGLVGSMLVGAAFERVPERVFPDSVGAEQLRAEVLEGPAAVSRGSAEEYLRGAGYSRVEAREIVDDVFGDEGSLFARFFGGSDDAQGTGTGGQGISTGKQQADNVAVVAAPLAVAVPASASLPGVGLSRLPMADPTTSPTTSPTTTPGSSSGTQITRFELEWKTADDVENNDPAVLYRRPDGDTLSDQVLQLVYGVQGERDYQPGEFVVTVPAKNFTLRDVSTGGDAGRAGSVTIPYPEDPRKTKDFNWKLVGDNYVITNTRTMSAATKGYIEMAVVYSGAVHDLRDMAKHDIQAHISLASSDEDALEQDSNVLQVQVDSHQEITSLVKRTNMYASLNTVPASQIPAAQRVPGEDAYYVVDWTLEVHHAGNQPYRLDLTDTISADYGGFILEATDSSGRKLEKNVFEGWSQPGSQYFYVKTAYPASQIDTSDRTCGSNHVYATVRNSATMKLTPFDGVDAASSKQGAASTQFHYFKECPSFNVDGNIHMCKFGNDGEGYNYSKVGTSAQNCPANSRPGGNYVTALNRLRDGEDVEIDYDVNTYGTLLPWIREGDERVLANYGKKSVTLTMTDTGVQLLGEPSVKAGTDFEFVSVNISKPSIGEASAYGVEPDGSFTEPFDDPRRSIRSVTDTNPAHIPVIKLEAKVGASWQKVADVDYSSGSCQVTYANGSTSTDCAHIALPSKTTQWRTSTTTNAASISYTAYPKVKVYATDAMQAVAANSFTDSRVPVRYMRNNATLVAKQAEGGSQIASINRYADDNLWGYAAESEVTLRKDSQQTGVNYNDGYVELHYTASGFEKWDAPDVTSTAQAERLWDELVELGEIEPLTSGVWYDLLPQGVYPVVGSVSVNNTVRDSSGAAKSTPGSVRSVRTVSDWQGSGRMMLIVELDYPRGSYSTHRYENGFYYYDQPVSLSFDARYDFDSITDYGRQTHNVIAFEAEKNTYGTVDGLRGEADNTRGSNHVDTPKAFKDDVERGALNNLNPEHNKPVFVYAGTSQTVSVLSAANTGLSKKVMANNNGIWGYGTYGDDIDVWTSGTYQYRLRIESDNATISKDLIFYDSFENFYAGDSNDPADVDAPRWQGVLKSIDVSQLEAMGVKPVIYYSTVPNLRLDDASNPKLPNAANVNLNNASVWSTTPPADLSAVRAIAIDARKKADGTDFELQPKQAINAVVRMAAPSGDAAAQAVEQDAHAYNNAFMVATSIDASTGVGDEKAFVRNDYTKVGLKEFSLNVAKQWDDDNNRDGIRPASITVRLVANGQDTGKSLTLSEADDWKGTFAHVAYADDAGNPIVYTFAEDEVAGYTSRSGTVDDKTTIRNTHEPERISVNGVKTWVNAEGAPIPEQITVALLADGKQVATKTVKPDTNGAWTYEFTNLHKYRDGGVPIVYSVKEAAGADGWLATVDGMNLTNTWHPYGDVVLSKRVENATNVTGSLDFSFAVSLLDANENVLTGSYEWEASDGRTGTVKHGDTLTLRDGQSLRIKELPMGAKVITEEADRPGFSVQGGAVKSVDVEANKDAAIAYTNTYTTVGRINLEAAKTLTGQPLRQWQFVFNVVNEQGQVIRSAANNAEGAVTFGAITYSNADAGKTYTYTIKEQNTGLGGVTYDTREYQARVTVTDNGDGTMTPTVEYVGVAPGGKPTFANEYHASGAAEVKAWKELDGRELKNGEFTFQLLDANGTVLQTKRNKADGTIDFDALQFNETHVGEDFLYVVREVSGTDNTVVYDDSVFGYIISPVDQRDGTLGFNLTKVGVKQEGGVWVSTGETGDVAVFENGLKPGGFSVEKHTTDGSADQEFRFKVKLTGKDVPENGTYNYDLTDASLPVNNISFQLAGEALLGDGVDSDVTFWSARGFGPLDSVYTESLFPEYDSSYSFTYGKLTSPSGQEYDCKSGNAFIFNTCDIEGERGVRLTRSSSGQINFVYQYKHNPMEKGAWTWNFRVSSGDKSSYVTIPFHVYDIQNECTPGSLYLGNYVCGDASTTSALSRGDNATTGNTGVVLAKQQRSLVAGRAVAAAQQAASINQASVQQVGVKQAQAASVKQSQAVTAAQPQAAQAQKASSGAQTQAQASQSWLGSIASFFGIGGIKPKTGIINGTFAGVPVTFDEDTGTLTIPDGSTLTTPSDLIWLVGIDKTKVKKIVGSNIVLPAYSANMFFDWSSLTDISALSTWDTSNVTNMRQMFDHVGWAAGSQLADLSPLANWDVSNVTNMREMFRGVPESNFPSDTYDYLVPLAGWDVSNVTNVDKMFVNNPYTVDFTPLAGWDLSSATDIDNFFASETVTAVRVIDVSNWNTRVDMSYTARYAHLYSVTVGANSSVLLPDGTWLSPTGQVLDGNNLVANEPGTWVRTSGREVTVKFDAGLGVGSKPDMKLKVGNYRLPSGTGFHRAGYSFAGWEIKQPSKFTIGQTSLGPVLQIRNISSLDDFDWDPVNEVYFLNNTVTLVAQWEPRDTSFNVQDGEFEFTLRGGEKATFNDIPAGTAYEVYEMTEKGWVLVEYSGTSGVIQPTEISKASFTNRPIDGVATVQVEASKLLDGEAAAANAFDFTLSDGANSQTVKNAAGGRIGFKQILVWDDSSITEAQMLARTPQALRDNAFAIYPASALPKSLTLSEVRGSNTGIEYDTRTVTVTVKNPFTLADGQEAVTYSRTPVFENTTKPGALTVTKNVAGAPSGDASEFGVKIELVNENNVPLADTGSITAKIGSTNVPLTWADGATTVKLRGGQTLTLDGIPAGVGYTVSEPEADMPRGWAQTGATGARGTIQAGATSAVTITNTYGASGEVTLEAYKGLVGRELQEGEFEFELVDSSGNVVATAKNLSPDIRTQIADEDGHWSANPHKGHGSVLFDNIKITKAGTYTYTIREKAGTDTTVTYDTRTVTARVVATDNGNGTLSFTTTYTGGKDGANLFENTVVPLHFWLKKTITNAGDVPAEYKDALFLYHVKLSGDTDLNTRSHAITYSGVEGDVSGEYRPAQWSGDEMVIGVRAGEEVQLAYFPWGTLYEAEEIGWVLDGERHELGDTFGYERGEHMSDAVNGLKATRTAHAHNTYLLPPPENPPVGKTASATVKAHKAVSGDYRLQGDDFTFELVDFEGNVVDTATNTASGEVTFGEITVSEADLDKVHTYYIRERVGDDASPRWKYDTSSHKVEIVTDKNDEGELVVTVNYDDGEEPTFTNTYIEPVGYAALRADKEIEGEGADLAEGDFQFKLLAPNGAVVAEAANSADGSVFFPTITYGASDIGKTYTYRIVEVKGNEPGWTYDEHTETVRVTVTDTGGTLLAVDAEYDADGAVFVNSYEFNPPPTGLMISDDARGALLLVLLALLAGTAWAAGKTHHRRTRA